MQALLLLTLTLTISITMAKTIQRNKPQPRPRQEALSLSSSLSSTCTNPPHEKMKPMLEEMYQKNMDQIIAGIEYFPKEQSIFLHSIVNVNVPLNHNLTIHGTKSCTRTTTNMTTTCPFHLAEVTRDDIYPYMRLHAVPNCNKCLHQEDVKELGCQPLYVTLFALKRGECRNGVYEWAPILERVAVAATCSHLHVYG